MLRKITLLCHSDAYVSIRKHFICCTLMEFSVAAVVIFFVCETMPLKHTHTHQLYYVIHIYILCVFQKGFMQIILYKYCRDTWTMKKTNKNFSNDENDADPVDGNPCITLTWWQTVWQKWLQTISIYYIELLYTLFNCYYAMIFVLIRTQLNLNSL